MNLAMNKIFLKISHYTLLVVMVFFVGRFAAVAQEWINPDSSPPINNVDQPPSASGLDDYVHKSPVTIQRIQGPVNVSAASSMPSIFAEESGDPSATASIVGSATAGSITMYADGDTGVYAYGAGSEYGIVGFSDASSGESVGVYGRGANGRLAGRFFGPVNILENAVTSAGASFTAGGLAEFDQGLTCLVSDSCTPTSTSWIDVTHTNDGTAVYGVSVNSSGITAAVDDTVAGGGYVADAYSSLSYGAGGLGQTGIHAVVDGTLSTQYIGAYGLSADTTNILLNRKGAYGISAGGMGSDNYKSASQPRHDFPAGVRACVKNSTGVITNTRGVYGNGGAYAAYFDGDGSGDGFDDGDVLILSVCSNDSFIQCSSDSDCGSGNTCMGKLQIGNKWITKTNLRGMICKASGIPIATCFGAAVCGNGSQEDGEECDDGNTDPLDGCSATCTIE